MPLPPGPRHPTPTLVRFFRDPLGLLLGTAEEHGDVALLPMGPRPVQRCFVSVSHPDHVRHVLQRHDDRYRKAFTYEPLRRFLGEGLLTSEGVRWRQHRRLAQPFLTSTELQHMAPLFVAACQRLLERWDGLAEAGTVIDVGHEMRRLTLDIVGRALFGVDLSSTAREVGAAVEVLQDLAMRQVMSPRSWLGWSALPQRTSRRHAEAVATLDRVVGQLIEQRAAHPEGYDDLLAGLLLAAQAEGTTLTPQELRDQLVTFLAAGHETTANALAWTWYLLGRNPAPRRRLHAEVDPLLTDRSAASLSLDELPFTGAVVAESLRLYPPAWTIERDALVDDVIGGYDIPAGATLVTSPWVLHRRSSLWDDPLAFDPDRFLDERAEQRDRGAYLPFGVGRRQCIGARFAQLESTLSLALLAGRYHLELAPDQRVQPEPRITLRMRRPLRAALVRRRAPGHGRAGG